jgi:hypothetical protein
MLRLWESSRELCEGEKTAVEMGRVARLQREDRRRYLLSDRFAIDPRLVALPISAPTTTSLG